jgi:hypothetical protein
MVIRQRDIHTGIAGNRPQVHAIIPVLGELRLGGIKDRRPANGLAFIGHR